jgi:hypothetical protein
MNGITHLYPTSRSLCFYPISRLLIAHPTLILADSSHHTSYHSPPPYFSLTHPPDFSLAHPTLLLDDSSRHISNHSPPPYSTSRPLIYPISRLLILWLAHRVILLITHLLITVNIAHSSHVASRSLIHSITHLLNAHPTLLLADSSCHTYFITHLHTISCCSFIPHYCSVSHPTLLLVNH